MAATPRRFRWGFLLLGLILVGLIVLLVVLGQKPPTKRTPPPTLVTTTKATQQDVQTSITALGAAQAWQSVLINPQVNGRITYVAQEGQEVRTGAVLVQIDCGSYLAALTQTQGALKRDQSLMAGHKVDLARFQTLVAQNSIARQTADDEAALVKQDEGTVLADQGNVQAAQVNVRYCRITSPVDGRVGVRMVDPGNIVTTGLTTGIVSVNQVQPIAVTFTIDEGEFQHLSQVSNGFTQPLPVEAMSQETGADLGAGELAVADNHVDQTTGTVQMKARFANDGRTLWPGQFVNVKLTLQTLHNAVTVPTSAVNQGPNGSFVYVVNADSKAIVTPVTVLTTENNVAVIQSGITAGETVVTDGQMSLRPNATVRTGSPGGPGGRGPGGKGAAGGRPGGHGPGPQS